MWKKGIVDARKQYLLIDQYAVLYVHQPAVQWLFKFAKKWSNHLPIANCIFCL